MENLIAFESDEYGTILIEAHEPLEDTRRGFSNSEESKTTQAKEKFENSINVLKSISTAVVKKLKEAGEGLAPDELEIKVGLKFSAETNAFIAKATSEGHLEVTMKWTDKNKQRPASLAGKI